MYMYTCISNFESKCKAEHVHLRHRMLLS
jgi:hypothetical protein